MIVEEFFNVLTSGVLVGFSLGTLVYFISCIVFMFLDAIRRI